MDIRILEGVGELGVKAVYPCIRNAVCLPLSCPMWHDFASKYNINIINLLLFKVYLPLDPQNATKL